MFVAFTPSLLLTAAVDGVAFIKNVCNVPLQKSDVTQCVRPSVTQSVRQLSVRSTGEVPFGETDGQTADLRQRSHLPTPYFTEPGFVLEGMIHCSKRKERALSRSRWLP